MVHRVYDAFVEALDLAQQTSTSQLMVMAWILLIEVQTIQTPLKAEHATRL
jgi:hypothetical protein